MGAWWRWALISPDGVAARRMVGVSASVNVPLHHKVQRFSSGTGSPGWSRKKGPKMVVCVCVCVCVFNKFYFRSASGRWAATCSSITTQLVPCQTMCFFRIGMWGCYARGLAAIPSTLSGRVVFEPHMLIHHMCPTTETAYLRIDMSVLVCWCHSSPLGASAFMHDCVS